MFRSLGTHPSGIGTSGLLRVAFPDGGTKGGSSDGSLTVPDGSAEAWFRVLCSDVPGFVSSRSGGNLFPGIAFRVCCSGFCIVTRYSLAPPRPPLTFTETSPEASSRRTTPRAPRSVSRAFSAIRAIDGKHRPLSSQKSARASMTRSSVWSPGPCSHTHVMTRMLILPPPRTDRPRNARHLPDWRPPAWRIRASARSRYTGASS